MGCPLVELEKRKCSFHIFSEKVGGLEIPLVELHLQKKLNLYVFTKIDSIFQNFKKG